ncbi:MAG TPA: dihydropteroate synthase [Dehalococcoidia bacterium]|nr:dihydropteroate synthase [Dehalococcoidia bacterium]
MTNYISPELTIGNRRFVWGSRTYVMGIVNVSPESFSGDGLTRVEDAVEQAQRFAEQGADIIDIGGMSTRPNFDEISVEQERDRVVPVVRAVVAAVDLPVSIDSYRSQVASAALMAGASIVNDITGFRRDPAMARLVAGYKVAAIVMHNQRGRAFHEVIADIKAGLTESLALADDAEVARKRLIIDPGFGFGWAPGQSLEIIRRLAELRDLGLPILTGTSRKSSIGAVLGLPEDQRAWGTAASVALSIANGADIVRVHDVGEMLQVVKVADAIVRAQRES